MTEFIEQFEEVFGGASQAVTSPDRDHIKVAKAGIGQESIEPGTFGSSAADAVIAILADHSPAALLRQLLQILQLVLGMLIERANPRVRRGSFHFACFSNSRMRRSS